MGWQAVVLVKCLDEDGSPTWAFRTTEGFSDEELLRAFTVRQELQRKKLISDHMGSDDD